MGVKRVFGEVLPSSGKTRMATSADVLLLFSAPSGCHKASASVFTAFSTAAFTGIPSPPLSLNCFGAVAMFAKTVIVPGIGIALIALGVWTISTSHKVTYRSASAATASRQLSDNSPESPLPSSSISSSRSKRVPTFPLTAVQSNSSEETYEEHRREINVRRINERLGVLSHRLQLCPDQVMKVKAIMEQGMSEREQIVRRFAQELGKDSGHPMLPENVIRASDQMKMDQQIAEIIDPEQKVAFDDFLREQKENYIKLEVNHEMLRLQEALTFTQEQKDKIYQALSQILEEEYGHDAHEENPFLPKESAEQQLRRQAVLASILSEEQMKTYTKR